MDKPAKNTICIWYERDAEAAARFYAKTFPTHPFARCTSLRQTSRPGKRDRY